MSQFKRMTLAAATAAFTISASAAGLDLGNGTLFGIVSAGAGSSLKINSGPVTGSVLVGDGTSVSTSGGNNGQITGVIADDGTVPQSAFGGLQTPPTSGQFSTVSASYVQSAVASAQAVSAYASSLAPVKVCALLMLLKVWFGASGVYVIDVNNIQNADLTFSGNASTRFVVNVSGTYQTNKTITLSGVSPSQLLFNFTGTSGNVFQTSGGDLSYGTYLATDGGNFQFSNLNLTGALINTAGHIEFVSGSKLTAAGLVPEPQSYAMLLAGMGVVAFVSRRRSPGRHA